MLSLTVKFVVLILVVVPLTVKLPLTITSLNVTLLEVPTAWPISMAPVPDVYVTPVPPDNNFLASDESTKLKPAVLLPSDGILGVLVKFV